MPKPRNRRADSNTAAVVAAQNAAQPTLEPPEHVTLPTAARPFWLAIMENRPRHRWNEVDLANAAVMARAQADVERLHAEIAVEGDVIAGQLNPKHRLLETLARRVVALARVLHVHPEATEGRARDAGKTLELEKRAKGTVGDNVHRLIPRAV